MTHKIPVLVLLLLSPLSWADAQQNAKAFVKMYEAFAKPIGYEGSKADWSASTDVNDQHVGERIGAGRVAATFFGNKYVIETARSLLKHRGELDYLTVREIENILRAAAQNPGTIPDVVNERVEAEAKQSAILDGFEFCLKHKGEKCAKKITPNEIDKVLKDSKDMGERLRVWEAAKEVGVPLKPGLVHLRDLRNRVAKEMNYTSFFDLQVSDYDMKVKEMMSLLNKAVADNQPLFLQLHCWTKRHLAQRYHQPVPKLIPAHWLGNRWGQEWPGLVNSVDMDPLFKGRTAEWIVQTAEQFYVNLGFPKLPESFWKKSDLYVLPSDSTRKKNTHASAWHLDLDHDVRSLMSVEPDWYWFGTAHHELGHIFYYLSYSRPEIPLVLREGANRAFHEAVGDLIFIASTQPEYLTKIGLLPPDRKLDETQWLLDQALGDAPIFLPWSAGVMSVFEHDLYEKNLPESEFNSRWWELVAKYQGIEPPATRPATSCDACTKTHINDDAAQYYDYAMAFLLKYQLHDHICRRILKKDVHHCDYSGNKKVGMFLREILNSGKTRDWRKLILETTGEPLSSRAVQAYFKPVMEYLVKENQGADCSM